MRIVWALAAKDLRLLLSDRMGCFFVFFWPLIFVVFFGYVTAGMYQSGSDPARPIEVAVVDEDSTEGSRDFLKSLAEFKALKLYAVGDRREAEAMVLKGERAACIVVHRGFGAASERIFWGDPMELEIIVDPARPLEAAMTQGLVQASAFRQIQGLFTDPERRKKHLRVARDAISKAANLPARQRKVFEKFFDGIAGLDESADRSRATDPKARSAPASNSNTGDWSPIRVQIRQAAPWPSEDGSREKSLSSFSVTFPQGILWGVMACAATFASSLLVERTRGTLPRLTIAPIHPWQIIAGKGLACFLIAVCVCVGMIVLGRLAFGVSASSYLLLAVAVACVGFAVVGMMMLFAVLGRTEAAVSGISWAVLIVMAMFGGGMIPLVAMKGWMLAIGNFSIFRWGIQAIEGAVWRGYNLADMALPCGVLLMIGAGGLLIGVALFRLRDAS
jgi:ABC-2 type transport system permease protein